MHFSLKDCIEKEQVQWIQRGFQDEDLKTLGREEVDCVADAVFVTGGDHDLSMSLIPPICFSGTEN